MADGPQPGMSGRPKVSLDATEPADAGVRRVLLYLAATIAVNVPGTLEEVDPEHLHELRVAVRRSRSVLRASKGVLPGDLRRKGRADLGWLGAVTGPARDLDVQLLGWEQDLTELPPHLRSQLEPVRESIEHAARLAHEDLAVALRSARFVDFLGGWTSSLRAGGGKEREALGPVIARRVAKAHRRVIDAGRAIGPDTPAEELHELRKLGKQLRYLIECFADLFPKEHRKAVVKGLKVLQDNLGEHQDAEVHLGIVQALEVEGAAPAIAALSGLLDGRRLAARGAFAVRFAAFDSEPVAASFDAMLRPLR